MENEAPEVTISPVSIYAETESAMMPETKVYVDENLQVLWNAGDKISVFLKSTQNRAFVFTGSDGDKSGDFDVLTAKDGSEAIERNYAVYPWRETNSIGTDGTLSLILPETQTWQSGSIDPAAQTMVAVSDNNSFRFKNLFACLGFQLYGEGIQVASVKIAGRSGEKIAGQVSVTAGDDPTFAFNPEAASTEISLVAETPVSMDASVPTLFWMIIPPITFDNGFTLTVTDDQGNVFVRNLTHSVSFARNYSYRMAALEVVPQPALPTEIGLYLDGSLPHIYNPETEQISIYEAEEKVWVRLFTPSDFRVWELGPIPASIAVGEQFTAELCERYGAEEVSSASYLLNAVSLDGGILTLSSGENDFFVTRF